MKHLFTFIAAFAGALNFALAALYLFAGRTEFGLILLFAGVVNCALAAINYVSEEA
jgi:hypothetical protein